MPSFHRQYQLSFFAFPLAKSGTCFILLYYATLRPIPIVCVSPGGLGSHQHGVHLHPSTLQVLADRGDLVVGQVCRVLLVELQQALQLVLGLVADVLEQGKRDTDARSF